MVKKLRQIWERKGIIDIFDLDNDFYLVSFEHMDDYMEALTGGPWVINDAYLNVARWRSDFNPKNAKVDSVIAWVRFPVLPAPLFDKKFLLNLGNVIGRATKLDIHTAQRSRGKFARMCVELDLTKPLVPEFDVEGQRISIVYESLGLLCNKCGCFGHTKEGCEEVQRKKCEQSMEVEQTTRAGQSVDGAGVERDRWQTMQRPRRLRRATGFTQRPPNGSRFSVLNEDVGDVEQQYRAEGVGEGSAGDGSNKIVQGESRLKEHKGQGSLAKKSVAPPRESSERSSTKEGQVDMATTRMKERDGGGFSRGPDCILPLQRHRSVVFVEKENLNPGDLNSRGRGKAEMARGKENWGGGVDC
ncbi:hypothetical protein K1719_020373 [Acacia pycnantha]|nr:hypothetical protein K1719_020373 [Acacia pycnantha]